MLQLGAHVSVAGGVDMAIERASKFGMTSCQIFTKNASQWAAKPLPEDVIERFRGGWQDSGIGQIVAHDSYLINLASPDPAMWEKSRLAMMIELERCDALGISYLVSHPGAHMGEGVEAGVERVAEAINRIHAGQPDGKASLLLETTAGQGTTLGRSFEELGAIIARVEDRARVAVCFDTCHVFAAGYDIREPGGYAATMHSFDDLIGFDLLRVFHLNDSLKPLGSHVDRHAHIGQGELGLEPFRHLLNDERFAGLPGILETAKGDDGAEDRMNLDTLLSLVAT